MVSLTFQISLDTSLSWRVAPLTFSQMRAAVTIPVAAT